MKAAAVCLCMNTSRICQSKSDFIMSGYIDSIEIMHLGTRKPGQNGSILSVDERSQAHSKEKNFGSDKKSFKRVLKGFSFKRVLKGLNDGVAYFVI